MTAQDVINLAKNAELKQLAVKTDDSAVLGFINLGLLEIYKRFSLKEAEAIITQTLGKSSYTLNSEDPDVSVSENDNLLLVVAVYNEKGECLPINDANDPKSIYTPTYNTIEIPDVIDGEILSVIYRVSPKFLTSVDDTVPIPPQLLEALLNYVGYKGHTSINDKPAEGSPSYLTKFENSCLKVMYEGLLPQDDISHSKKFITRGFV